MQGGDAAQPVLRIEPRAVGMLGNLSGPSLIPVHTDVILNKENSQTTSFLHQLQMTQNRYTDALFNRHFSWLSCQQAVTTEQLARHRTLPLWKILF